MRLNELGGDINQPGSVAALFDLETKAKAYLKKCDEDIFTKLKNRMTTSQIYESSKAGLDQAIQPSLPDSLIDECEFCDEAFIYLRNKPTAPDYNQLRRVQRESVAEKTAQLVSVWEKLGETVTELHQAGQGVKFAEGDSTTLGLISNVSKWTEEARALIAEINQLISSSPPLDDEPSQLVKRVGDYYAKLSRSDPDFMSLFDKFKAAELAFNAAKDLLIISEASQKTAREDSAKATAHHVAAVEERKYLLLREQELKNYSLTLQVAKPRLPADLVFLLNPATEASASRQMDDFWQGETGQRLRRKWNELSKIKNRPWIAAISAKNDTATKYAFPIAQAPTVFFSGLLGRNADTFRNEGFALSSKTAPNRQSMITHKIEKSKDGNGFRYVEVDPTNVTPFWIIQADKTEISGHTGHWESSSVELLIDLTKKVALE